MASDYLPLPEFLQSFLWDCDFSALSWDEQHDFITRRLLQHGSWEALSWLRGQLGDTALRRWIIQQQGAGLSPRQVRFWEAILGLPPAEVQRWLEAAAGQPWQRRLNP